MTYDDRELLQQLLGALPPNDRILICRLYIALGDDGSTRSDFAAQVGMSRSKLYRREQTCMEVMRNRAVAMGLRVAA